MVEKYIDMTSQTFGALTVLKLDRERTLRGRTYWITSCICGEILSTSRDKLISGKKQSCGCLTENLGQFKSKHDMSGTPEYRAWRRIKSYCHNPNVKHFKHYGGRGISICQEWDDSFEEFYKYVGNRPSRKHSIDRIDVNGNYEPGNVKWSTQKEQMQNTRKSIHATIHGVKFPIREWCKILGHDPAKIYARINRQGMTPEEALLKT